ncbi:10462_t:CDS:2 [Gigaspora margarita]|uniref:10462_t:CDS:1 n=1 Tax=Gigaspora margarita TaxID=4874 RepID=A0ABN7W5H4_GIGMA|nr:10462_t:CDS:2 [Gigaspora margarita]
MACSTYLVNSKSQNKANQVVNAEASNFDMVNIEVGTSYTVNIEFGTSYVINAKVGISYVINAKVGTSYMVTSETNRNTAIVNAEGNVYKTDINMSTDYENVTDKNAILEVFNEVGYTFQTWDDMDSFFRAYGQHFGFSVIKKRTKQHNDRIIKHRSFG